MFLSSLASYILSVSINSVLPYSDYERQFCTPRYLIEERMQTATDFTVVRTQMRWSMYRNLRIRYERNPLSFFALSHRHRLRHLLSDTFLDGQCEIEGCRYRY